jgi:hypothetical protein
MANFAAHVVDKFLGLVDCVAGRKDAREPPSMMISRSVYG